VDVKTTVLTPETTGVAADTQLATEFDEEMGFESELAENFDFLWIPHMSTHLLKLVRFMQADMEGTVYVKLDRRMVKVDPSRYQCFLTN